MALRLGVILQVSIEHCAQRHWGQWLVQQLIAACARMAQPFGGDVTADEKGRNQHTESGAQTLDYFNACFPAGQMIVRNNEIGPLSASDNLAERSFVRGGGNHTAAPAA